MSMHITFLSLDNGVLVCICVKLQLFPLILLVVAIVVALNAHILLLLGYLGTSLFLHCLSVN